MNQQSLLAKEVALATTEKKPNMFARVWLKGGAVKPTNYSDPTRLADVMALIQVLAQAEGTIRTEAGLTENLQGKPKSKGMSTWTSLAESHHEFFRVHTDKDDSTKTRVALISRHALDRDEQTKKRPPLSTEFTSKLLELAISLHDRAALRRQRFQYLIPVAATILVGLIAGFFLIMATLLQISHQTSQVGK